MVAADDIDAELFEGEVEEAHQAFRAGEFREARAALRGALGRWRGEALSDVAGLSWAHADQARLGEMRLMALELFLESHLALGDAEQVVALAEAAVSDNPLRERLWALLMVALYRCDRQADALRAFQRVRCTLADELGLNPGPHLIAIERAILAQEPGLGGGVVSNYDEGTVLSGPAGTAPAPRRLMVAGGQHLVRPGVKSAPVRPNSLPRQLTDFIGRRQELEHGAQCLSRHRLVTITGSAGCGKTRLALALAEQAAQGKTGEVWFVALDAIEPEKPPETPPPEAGGRPLGGVTSRESPEGSLSGTTAGDFGQSNMDFRRVASLLAKVLGLGDLGAGNDDAGSGEIVTSSRLDHRSDQLVQILADSIMQSAGETLVVLDNCEHLAGAVAKLAEQLLTRCETVTVLATGREPLGVPGEELFPIQPLGMPPEPATARRLNEILEAESFQLFIARARSALPGFEMDDEGIGLVADICRDLDGIPLAIELAAGLVCALSLRDIARQVDKQLELTTTLRQVPERQRTLEAAIDWSFRSLNAPERALLTRLAVFRGGFALEAAAAVSGGGDERRVATVLASLVRKSVVFREGGPHGTVRYRLLMAIRQYTEERLGAGDDEARRAHASYFRSLAELADHNAHGPDAGKWLACVEMELPNLRAAFTYSTNHGDLETGARLAGALRWFFGRMASFDEAVGWLDKMMARRHELTPALQIQVLNSWLAVAFTVGVFTSTAEVGEEAVNMARELENGQELATTLTMRGATAAYEGTFERAITCFGEAEGLCRSLGDRWGLGWLLTAWGFTDRRMGDLEGSRAKLEAALEIFNDIGDLHSKFLPTLNLGLIAQQTGDLDCAARLCEGAAELARQIGNRQYRHVATCSLGRVALDQGDNERARELLSTALRGFPGVENRVIVVIALEGLAIIAGRHSRFFEAVALWGHTDRVRRESRLPLTDKRRLERDLDLARARSVLGDRRFDEAWAVGQPMAARSATALAIDASSEPVSSTQT